MIRVLMYVHWANVGGAEDMAIDEIKYADRNEIDYIFVTETEDSPTHREISSLGVPVERIKENDEAAFRQIADDRQIDVIHTLSCGVSPDLAIRSGVSAGKKVVEVLACVAPPSLIGNPLVTPIYLCEKHRYHGFSNNPMGRIIIGGVDIARLTHRSAAEDRMEFGLDPNRPTIGWFGRFDQFKCPLSFVQIARFVQNEVPECQFVMFGNGADFGRAQYLATTAPVSIVFPGFTRNKGSAFNALDILVFPTWQEAFGRVMPEAMAVGTPIVTSDYPVCREVCESAAVYMPAAREDPMPRDVLVQYSKVCIELLGNLEQRADMVVAGMARARIYYDAARMSREFGELYKELVRS